MTRAQLLLVDHTTRGVRLQVDTSNRTVVYNTYYTQNQSQLVCK